ncbi:MAG: hypothetical protein Q9M16_07675 [Mariprofundus sp.]|nr:hypothetical protein [Mariprofundus sp.]
MKKIFMYITILMSVLMLSACEHYSPYYGGYGDGGYSDHGNGYSDGYSGGHGGGKHEERENRGHGGED